MTDAMVEAQASGDATAGRAGAGWRRALKPLASLRLTVVLFVLSMVLIYVGTVAQVDEGLWPVLEKYFRSWGVVVPVDLLFTEVFFPPMEVPAWLVFPMPGGYALGLALLVNLLAAHGLRFHLSAEAKASGRRRATGWLWVVGGCGAIAAAFLVPAVTNALAHSLPVLFVLGSLFFVPLMVGVWLLFGKRLGIVLVHASIVLLLVGEGVTSWQAREVQVPVYAGADQAIAWGHDVRYAELAVFFPDEVDEAGAARVVTVNESALRAASSSGEPVALADTGLSVRVKEEEVPGAQAGEFAAATVTFVDEHGHNAGGGLVSPRLMVRTTDDAQPSHRFERKAFETHGRRVEYAMRFARTALPFTVELIEFQHELYPGTSVPRHYGSDVRITDHATGAVRRAQIEMNDPLRYSGYTFFQSSWLPGDAGTVLQVVRNPGWTVPYIACIVGGLGLAVHFLLSLMKFTKRERKRRERGLEAGGAGALGGAGVRVAVVAAVLVSGGYLLGAVGKAMDPGRADGFDLAGFGRLVVAEGGRFKPIDSLARDTLLTSAGRESVDLTPDGLGTFERMRQRETKPALVWLLDSAVGRAHDTDPVFRIDHRDVKALLGIGDDGDFSRKRFTLAEVRDGPARTEMGNVLTDAIRAAVAVPSDERDEYQRALAALDRQMGAVGGVISMSLPRLVPPGDAGEAALPSEADVVGAWATLPLTDPANRTAGLYRDAFTAWANGDASAFNQAVLQLTGDQRRRDGALHRKLGVEQAFNAYRPYAKAIALYLGAGLCVLGSWVFAGSRARRPLHAVGVAWLVVGLVLHTLALVLRVYLSGRPPVTNLYSSAVFVGWAAVLLALPMERVLRDGLALMVGVVAGVATLLIARGLDDGDNMAVLQAVLDTNFWLATHVITITLGYSAAYVAALLGVAYVFAGVFTDALRGSRRLEGVIYGVTAFALLLSFVGTILGGIWADQSWGRFWGWDPKENGAMLIVIWTALILHARWGGLVRGRGIAVLAILGGVVTSWSWFGVNLLGAGLHAYGFIDEAPVYLRGVVVGMLAVAALASLPVSEWKSFRKVEAGDGRASA